MRKTNWIVAILPVILLTACATNGELEALGQYTKTRLNNLESRIENKKLLGLFNEAEAVKAQLAKIRGEVEWLQHELTETKKRQNDLYNDLDARIQEQSDLYAKKNSSAIVSESMDVPPTNYQQALILIREHQFDQALLLLNPIAKAPIQEPQLADVSFWIGVAYVGLNQLEQAISAYQHFVEQNPIHPKAPQALYYIASCQQSLNQTDKSLNTLQELIKRYPKSEAAIKYQKQSQSKP